MTELMHSLFLPVSTKCLASSAHKACTCSNSSCDCSRMMNHTESMYFTAPRVTLYATIRQHSCATDKTRRSRSQSPIALTCANNVQFRKSQLYGRRVLATAAPLAPLPPLPPLPKQSGEVIPLIAEVLFRWCCDCDLCCPFLGNVSVSGVCVAQRRDSVLRSCHDDLIPQPRIDMPEILVCLLYL